MNPQLHIVGHEATALTRRESACIRAILYFDIFHYPLTVQEVLLFMDYKVSHLSEVQSDLDRLCENLLLYRFGDLYTVHNNASLAERRRSGNARAAAVLPKAQRRSKRIQSFPFVRSVMISGSLSKNYFDAQSDVDFLVVTEPGRLWLCRLLLTLYKKIFLLNKRTYFCINYYIDTRALRIPDENIFAATEIITLMHQTGDDVYNAFLRSNVWVKEYFPNFIPQYATPLPGKSGFFKRMGEFLLGGKFGNTLDHIAFSFTQYFLRKKYKHIPQHEYAVSFRGQKHASKHHPQGFQFRVAEALEQRCRTFEQQHGVSL